MTFYIIGLTVVVAVVASYLGLRFLKRFSARSLPPASRTDLARFV
jgi:hypothetical protein